MKNKRLFDYFCRMKISLKLVFTALTISIFFSCNGVKSLTKKGDKATEKENYEKATNLYFSALAKDLNYSEAKSGLKNSAQRLVNKSLDSFFKAKNFNETRDAIYHYRDAYLLQKKAKRFQVTLNIPEQYTMDYNVLVDQYTEKKYEEGLEKLEVELFREAELIFKEIALLKPNFKDIDNLKKVAEFEPKYRQAISYLQNEKFRAAYYEFKKIPKSYKDTQEKMALSLEAGIITIGFIDFKNSTREKGGESAISAHIFNNLNKLNNPFIKVVDRSLTSTILNEQVLSLSGQVSESTATSAGNLIGAKTILSGNLITFNKNSKKLNETSKKAYLENIIKKKNEETGTFYYETTYDKVRYKEYYGKNEVSVGFQYQLTSTETGEILLTGIINLSDKDVVNFETTNVNYKKIVPGDWKWQNKLHKSDLVSTSVSEKRALRKLFTQKKTLLTIDQLKNNVFTEIANKVSLKIDQYNPENE